MNTSGIIQRPPQIILDYATELLCDKNSFVNGNLDHVSWVISVPNPPATRFFDGDSTATGLRSLVSVNSDSYAVPGAYLERPFTVPAGVTGIQIQLDEVQIPSGSTNAFALQLYDTSGITQISSTNFTPTTTPTNVATATITVVPGTEYKVRVSVNNSGQSSFLCGKLRVIPVTTSSAGIFGQPFKRLELYGCIQNTNEVTWYNPRFCPQNEFAFVEFETNSNFVIEYYNSDGQYIGLTRAAITPQIDNFPLDPPIVPTLPGNVEFSTVTVPLISWQGPRNIKVPAGPAVNNLFTNLVEDSGTYICAIYVPSNAYLQVVTNPPDLVVFYGDSKEAGFYSDSPGRDSMAFNLRHNNWSVNSVAKGGGAIFADCPVLSVAGCTSFAMKLARKNPSRLFIEIGRNDFTGGTNAANIVTQIGNLCDAIHATLPATNVILTTWTSETTENSVGGVAWDTERANIVALVSSRTPWCSYLDEARYWTPAEASSYTADTVHPNSLGHERKSRGRINSVLLEGANQYPWSPLELTPTVWLESLSPMTGGGAGTVTASGTSPPTVTVTGTAAVACALRVEVTTGGAIGSALFRWSVDSGRSWVAQNVVTAATVTLNPLGCVLNFASGSYSNDNVYTCSFKVAQWNDLSGNGNHFVQATGANQPLFNPIAYGNLPGVTFGAASKMTLSGLTFTNPYTLSVVCISNALTLLSAPISVASGYGPLLYVSQVSPPHIALNDSIDQLNASCDTSLLHTITAVSNLASSSVRVDGVASTGTLSAGTSNTTLTLGEDVPNVTFWNGSIMAFILVPRAMSSSECLNLEARWRKMFGTP